MERKKHTLIDKKSIDLLFYIGKSFKSFPLIIYTINSKENKVLFSVSKKLFLKAVDRNKIKRQLKSIYFNNYNLIQHKIKNKTIAFVYISKTKPTYLQLQNKMLYLISSINKDEE